MNLRAQNLISFLQLGEGVDDATWLHHLKRRDYSRWVRAALKDDDLADHIARIEEHDAVSPEESRRAVRKLIEARYTLPTD